MTVRDDVLADLDPVPYSQARKLVQDGDLLLCSAHDPMSMTIRWATHSPWSHIAIAYRIDALDRVMVLEAVTRVGVRTVPLSTFISRTSSGIHPYPGRIVLARHRAFLTDDPAAVKTMFDFAFDRLGASFAVIEMLKIALRVSLGRFDLKLPRSVEPRNEYICSEYVARCFGKIGLKIPWDGLGFIGPADFAADPAVKAVAQIQTC